MLIGFEVGRGTIKFRDITRFYDKFYGYTYVTVKTV